MLRAIVFDFDGVIANSEPLHFRAYSEVLGRRGVELTEGSYYQRYLGYDDVGAFQAIGVDNQQAWTPADIARLVAEKATVLERLERDTSVLFPGAAAAIRRLAAAVPLAIASGARGDEIRRVLDRERLAALFTAIVAAEDTPVSKPAPDPYERAVDLLSAASGDGVTAAECVAIEDSMWGLQSARAAGLRTVAVTTTYPSDQLRGAADLIIGSLHDLDFAALAQLCATA